MSAGLLPQLQRPSRPALPAFPRPALPPHSAPLLPCAALTLICCSSWEILVWACCSLMGQSPQVGSFFLLQPLYSFCSGAGRSGRGAGGWTVTGGTGWRGHGAAAAQGSRHNGSGHSRGRLAAAAAVGQCDRFRYAHPTFAQSSQRRTSHLVAAAFCVVRSFWQVVSEVWAVAWAFWAVLQREGRGAEKLGSGARSSSWAQVRGAGP